VLVFVDVSAKFLEADVS